MAHFTTRIRVETVTSADNYITTDRGARLEEGDKVFLTGDEDSPEVFASVPDAERYHLRRQADPTATHRSTIEGTKA